LQGGVERVHVCVPRMGFGVSRALLVYRPFLRATRESVLSKALVRRLIVSWRIGPLQRASFEVQIRQTVPMAGGRPDGAGVLHGCEGVWETFGGKG